MPAFIRVSFGLACLALAIAATTGRAVAADGDWNVTGGGDWSDTGNWLGGTVADGADFTATFGNVITGTATINLDSVRTIGNITASDTGQNYTISGANILTLDVTTGSPVVDVTTGNRTLTISSVIEGSDGLEKAGAGTLLLEGNSTAFTGNLSITGGTLRVGNNNTNSSLGGDAYAGDILNNGTLWYTTSRTQTLSGVISGNGTLNKGGSGTLTLTGANTYTGRTIIAGSGAGGPTLSVSSLNSVVGGTASSSLGAPTTVLDGTIQLGSSGNTRSCTLIYTGSGETTDRVMNVQFNSGATHTINNSGSGLLRFTSNFTITPSSGTTTGGLTLRGAGNGEVAQIGTIPGILRKEDAGTWTIGGTNASNSVQVNGGTLLVNGSLDATTTFTAGASTTLGGNATIGGAATISGILSPGNSPGQMTFDDSLALAATTDSLFELGGTTLGSLYDNITITTDGLLAYDGDLDVSNFGAFDMDDSSFTYDLFAFDGTTSPSGSFDNVVVNSIALTNNSGVWTGTNGPDVSYEFSQATGDLVITVVPEPGTLALLVGGAIAGFAARRRRRKVA